MKKQLFLSALVALIVSIATFAILNWFYDNNRNETITIEHKNNLPSKEVAYEDSKETKSMSLDFTKTADKVVNSVVHIRTSRLMNSNTSRGNSPFREFDDDDIFRYFFGPQSRDRSRRNHQPDRRAQLGSGSGVIINSNGYIITNNHVIENADDIEVILHDNRNYKAKVIGTDPSTDLALLQIKEENLPALALVNSDDVQIGEWVLAIGNPFSLNSTVTAGIVSAKARSINILRGRNYAVESFIQTDAAINPGNSGGALVNMQGGLIGINTAIASPTGAYTGYGFAVPSNIVHKVVEDLLKYGLVQRGVLGVQILSVDGDLAKEKGLNITEGVYVQEVMPNSAAEKAGIESGDVIISADNEKTNSTPELQEIIATHRPGDKVNIVVNRKGKNKTLTVTLKNREGSTSLVKKDNTNILNIMGCELEEIDAETTAELGIKGGIKVSKLTDGKLRRQTQMREGFIITHVNNESVGTVDDFINKVSKNSGGIMLAGFYEDYPGTYYYAFGLK